MAFRIVALFAFLSLVSLSLGDDVPKPIGPAEATKKIGENVTVRMEVKSAKLTKTNCFLNSEEDYKDAKNFTIFINQETLKKFTEAKIEDPATHFLKKTVEVTGKAILHLERPEIVPTAPDQIKIVEKK